jgi:hypothetical protein
MEIGGLPDVLTVAKLAQSVRRAGAAQGAPPVNPKHLSRCF